MDSKEDLFKKELKGAMEFDPLDCAEKITGKDYHDDEDTSSLGMLFHLKHSKVKKQLLSQNNDVYFNMSLEAYITTFGEMGFEKIYTETFKSESSEQDEELYCFWDRKRSVLLKFDTYTLVKKGLNGGQIYFNWKPNDKNYYLQGCSKHWAEDGTVVGDYDCREGVRLKLEEMDENGKFISPWIERPFYWLLNHADLKRMDNRQYIMDITEERIKKFPPDIQALIPPKSR